MFMKPGLVVALLGVFTTGCDVEDEHELFDVEHIEDARSEGQERNANLSADPVEAHENPGPILDFSEPSQTAGSGGISPPSPKKRCCVACADKWSGWWDLGTTNSPTCNKRGPEWCHDHNWNFVNAEWFGSCPTG